MCYLFLKKVLTIHSVSVIISITTKEVVLMNKCKATLADLEKAYVKGLYIAQYSSIYQPMFSYNAGFYAMEVYKTQYHKGLVKRGTYKLMTAKEANEAIGFKLLR